jgi:hypothetical protein
VKVKYRSSFFSFPVKSPWMKYAWYDYRNMSARRGAQLISTKQNIYVKQKLEQFDDTSFRKQSVVQKVSDSKLTILCEDIQLN